MRKLVYLLISAAVVTGFSSCGSCSNNGKATTEYQAAMVGSDRDEHGCTGSAGYQWSEVRQDCIRVFEQGIRLNDLTNPEATSSAFVVLAEDSLKVELFMPEGGKIILSRSTVEDGKPAHTWKSGEWSISDDHGSWVVLKGSEIVYSQSKE